MISKRELRSSAFLAFSSGLASVLGDGLGNIAPGCHKRRAVMLSKIYFEDQAKQKILLVEKELTSMIFGCERNSPKTKMRGLEMIWSMMVSRAFDFCPLTKMSISSILAEAPPALRTD